MYKFFSVVFSLLTVCIIPTNSYSAKVFRPSIEEQLQNAQGILEVKILEVKKNETYKEFKNKKKVIESLEIIVDGEVSKVLYGDYPDKKLQARYSAISSKVYDDEGNELPGKSPIRNGSGEEWKMEKGKNYILSYDSIDKNGQLQLIRADIPQPKKPVKDTEKSQ